MYGLNANVDTSARLCDVSVIVPCYKCASTIRRALESVAAQTLKPLEVILVDDCSPDHTPHVLEEIAASYQEEIRIRLLRAEKNGGAGQARNLGLRNATGSYAAFLDSDDAWHPKKLEVQYLYMISNPDLFLSGHNSTVLCTSEDRVVPYETGVKFRMIGKWDIIKGNPFRTSSVMMRLNSDYMFPRRRYAEDYALWMRVVLEGRGAGIIQASLAYYYKDYYGAGGLSARLWSMEVGELRNFSEMYDAGLIGVVEFVLAFVYSFFKYIRRLVISFYRSF